MNINKVRISDFSQLFSAQLKNIRRDKQLTQAQVAEILNVPKSTYANWEQGRREPSIADIYNILISLDIDANELFAIL